MYGKYSEDELIEAYTTMMDYSGKVESEILNEIEHRGGLEKFLQSMQQKEVNKKESDRILNEIIRFNKEGNDLETIKKIISSEIWTKQHLDAFVENRYIRHQFYLNDKSIDKEVVTKSILGVIVSSLAGTSIWAFSMLFLKFVFFPILIVVYFVSYFIIKGFTGKTRNNGVVFIASFVSTIISFLVGFFILNKYF